MSKRKTSAKAADYSKNNDPKEGNIIAINFANDVPHDGNRMAVHSADDGPNDGKIIAVHSANNHLHDEQTGGYFKMSKRLILTDKEGNKYTLEFNRITVDRMQRSGFVLDTDRLYMSAKDLISGAFRMHHRGMEWPEIEKIWKAQNRRDELLKKLVEMFYEPTIDLMGTADEKDDDENPTWAEET